MSIWKRTFQELVDPKSSQLEPLLETQPKQEKKHYSFSKLDIYVWFPPKP